jgi:hypothetical protein
MYLRLEFGNKEKFESTETTQGMPQFKSPKALATYLRKVATDLEKYNSEKAYNNDDNFILEDRIVN